MFRGWFDLMYFRHWPLYGSEIVRYGSLWVNVRWWMWWGVVSLVTLTKPVYKKGSLIGGQRPMASVSIKFSPRQNWYDLAWIWISDPPTTQHILLNKIKYTRPNIPADLFSIIYHNWYYYWYYWFAYAWLRAYSVQAFHVDRSLNFNRNSLVHFCYQQKIAY